MPRWRRRGGWWDVNNLVLSLFPGIGLLDRAFEEAGFCVVRGPDLLWGGDVKTFHPPAGRFDGVIGGPPCQLFGKMRYLNPLAGKKVGNLIPEFERVVFEAQPLWFLMENVPDAPEPAIAGYGINSLILNNRWVGGEQNRIRRFSFGVLGASVDLSVCIDICLLESATRLPTACASGGVKPGISRDSLKRAKNLGWKTAAALKQSITAQGLPEGFLSEAPFTLEGKHKVIGNGVPLPMGRAIARAVKEALNL